MPELPDIELYVDALDRHLTGEVLEGVRLVSPFLLRSVEPALVEFEGRRVVGFRRIGKRIVFDFGDELFLVFHLMIAGRFRWKKRGAKVGRPRGLAGLDFSKGTLVLTEASKKKRASLYCVRGEAALADHDPGGLEVFGATFDAFRGALTARNHTIKRALTDPRITSGVGNGYSDEILWTAEVSPVKWTTRLTDDELRRLHQATQTVMATWRERLIEEVGDGFPDKVTAFRPEMAVHGKFGEPCPRCRDPVQRIRLRSQSRLRSTRVALSPSRDRSQSRLRSTRVALSPSRDRAANEVNYCATCQTGGKVLADRGLSRLLKGDWPKTLEELEALKAR